jgi:hypothetical protein
VVGAFGAIDEAAADNDSLQWHLDQYRLHHGRTARYQELLALLAGGSSDQSSNKQWAWIIEAMNPLLSEARG